MSVSSIVGIVKNKKCAMLRVIVVLLFSYLLFPSTGFSQDILIKQDGEEMLVFIHNIGIDKITYRTNTKGPLNSILRSKVFMVKKRNGEVVYFDEGDDAAQDNNNKESPRLKAFEEGTTVWHIGAGIRSDLTLDEGLGLRSVTPPVVLMWEKCVFNNIGVGLKAGYQLWEQEKLQYNYSYASFSIRASYHPNLKNESIDPYLAVGASGRRVSIGDGVSREANYDFDAFLLVGCRYYFGDTFGVYGEIGADMLSYFNLGLSFRFN
jgi:hypothetical protein